MNILAKNLLILASAGSGKTFQLGNRVIGLVAKGVPPEKIVALTFTRKAAGEFADSVLTKLADAASDEKTAARLREELEIPDADFQEALEKVVRALPRFTLGTMDSFFAKVVRGFQYELGLTGGKFDLLEGPRAVAMTDEILAAILGETLEESGGDDFLHSFRRATIGKEELGVMDGLRGFVRSWQSLYRTSRAAEWGPADLAGVRFDDWEKQKHTLAAKVERGLDGIDYTRKGQREALEKAVSALTGHTIGSGSLNGATGMLGNLMVAAESRDGPLVVKYYKEFLIGGPAGEALRDLVALAARCELAAALHRTRAVREVVSVYDALCEKQLRQRGLLGFEDVKILMGEWVLNEDSRLRREAVDFRLDSRHEHWLLDEFQDTSRADWLGLLPLVDEAAGAGDGSMFVVGDRKQAIYAWRGGEVGLFDEVMARYGGDLEIEPMAESWRSCPEVLALVNQVCGDTATMRELFGDAAAMWQWQQHVSAAPLAVPHKHGEARVEVVEGKWEERLERLGGLLDELGVGTRGMTCGVLVRSNAKVREVADVLRAKGFDVIEEGRREPSKDNPVGITLNHLLKWLANPADAFSREVVAMSPLGPALAAGYGDYWQQVWEGLLGIASESGFSRMVGQVVESCWADWSDFDRRRAGDVMTALASLDAQGGATPQEAAEWIERLEVSQSPGVAAVQVMTIHKSKGLGFDVVVLPEIPNDSIPSAQYFDVAEGRGWITQTPPKWARDLIPELRDAEAEWSANQRYEAFCMLYVALTRSKRGLYVLLEPPSSSQDADKPSLANWLARSVGSNGQPGTIWQNGAAGWVEGFALSGKTKAVAGRPVLAAAIPRRERMTAGGEKQITSISMAGLGYGTEVHEAFEKIGWVDEAPPVLPVGDVEKRVTELLGVSDLRRFFERGGRPVELLREQPVDAVIDGKWLSGVMDRVHLHRDADGVVSRVEIIDFKTDPVEEISELVERYSAQMGAYREMMRQTCPAASVECVLLSTHLARAEVF
ncbi:UvrD-helicase domain-containing protein [Luteolibacter yonseiensis]|uniref:DNA 3'-5' helicase n=1 Tax=Luteolibacter yonseiensis TaxID=1144680 RepID=A0A934R6N6_9BACT|nr:UvrD-helicase domain-containing protein [Luteolibacter yonseiensis]MBK1816109.1 UvrD-helicase domain-containing protein [Luteolibacter yonseiensis]